MAHIKSNAPIRSGHTHDHSRGKLDATGRGTRCQHQVPPVLALVPKLLVLCSSEGSSSIQTDVTMGQYTPRCEHGVSIHLGVNMGSVYT